MLLLGILAVGKINEAADSGDATLTLEALQLPEAKLLNVDPRQASHYQFLLARFKQHKAAVSIEVTKYIYFHFLVLFFIYYYVI